MESGASVGSGGQVHRRVVLQGDSLKITVSSGGGRESSGGKSQASVAADLFEKLERAYFERRREIVGEDGFISTPLHALKKMSEAFGSNMHSEIFVFNQPGFGRQLWRVEILVGNARGVGQSPRRQLSFQMAALDILEKLKANSTELQLLPYGFLPGWRTGVSVFSDLKQFCVENQFPFPVYNVLKTVPFEEGPQYGIECRIGDLEEAVRSDDRFLAKRLAARKMYDKLTGNSYPEEEVNIGHQCVGLKELKQLGIQTLNSTWKGQWMMENRVAGDSIFTPEDEPEDGDFADFEDLTDHIPNPPVLPSKGQPIGITRVVKNEKAEKIETPGMDF